MKKYVIAIALAAAMLFAGTNASAQVGHFGVVGGMTFSKAKDVNKDMMKNYTGFHAGVTYQLNLPLGFSIQPELIYNQRGTKVAAPIGDLHGNTSVGFIELPVNIQWGPDLVLFRWEYGIGLGVGIEVWKFQLSGRYCWSFGNNLPETVAEVFDDAKFGGFELSLAFLF